MSHDLLFGLSALLALLAPALPALRRDGARDVLYWGGLAVGVAGPAAWAVVHSGGAWQTGFSATLWVTVAASMALFAIVAVSSREAWRLTPIMSVYMAALAVLALVWQQAAPVHGLAGSSHAAWMHIHIMVSVLTYGLVTIAGVASLAAFLQERALKRKRPTRLTRLLPSVAGSEGLLVRLLVLGEGVLGLGLITGMALQYRESGLLMHFDHKSVLTVASFLTIAGLLYAHYRHGMRGRRAARVVLVAYLLLTLGYPGVKFVTDVLLG